MLTSELLITSGDQKEHWELRQFASEAEATQWLTHSHWLVTSNIHCTVLTWTIITQETQKCHLKSKMMKCLKSSRGFVVEHYFVTSCWEIMPLSILWPFEYQCEKCFPGTASKPREAAPWDEWDWISTPPERICCNLLHAIVGSCPVCAQVADSQKGFKTGRLN